MKRVTIILAVLLVLFTVGAALSAGGYDLSWWTVDGGGGSSSGDGYSLSGTVGQPDAGVLSGGGYSLNGGYWGGASAQYSVYLPLIIKQ